VAPTGAAAVALLHCCPDLMLHCSAPQRYHQSSALCRAYDMAAIKLKGYDRANTNFPKSQYHHEPFMVVRA
jgi:hypothetical protein